MNKSEKPLNFKNFEEASLALRELHNKLVELNYSSIDILSLLNLYLTMMEVDTHKFLLLPETLIVKSHPLLENCSLKDLRHFYMDIKRKRFTDEELKNYSKPKPKTNIINFEDKVNTIKNKK